MKKKIKIFVKGIACLLLFGLFIGLVSFLNSSANSSEKEEMDWTPEKRSYPQGWEMAAENELFALYFEPSIMQLSLKDKREGTEWRSNPENAESDPIAFGQNKTAVRSLLGVTYVDDQSSYFTINSFAACVQDGTYTYEYADNGVYVNLQFAKQGFEIPCFFGIEEDRFVARVLSEQIVQHGSLSVAEISLLPYFGAGSLEDIGYMFVPDGCGALIYYNNQKQGYQSYIQRVYGNNLALNVQSNLKVAKDATMPVFGIKKNDAALLAVITQGEYQAEIKAEVARKTTSNNIVYTNIVYIQGENNTLLSGSDKEESTVMISPQHNHFPYYEVSYYFLEKDAGYNEMAARYHKYLVEEKGMKEEGKVKQERMNLTFLGGIDVRKTLLGVPYHTVSALTKFSELSKIAQELQESVGSNFQICMYGLEKGGIKSKMPTSLSYERALGGQSGYRKMEEALEKVEIPFYPIYDPVTIKKSGNGYRAIHGVRNVSRSASTQYDYLLTTGAKDSGSTPYYLVSPKYEEKIMTSLLKSAQKKGVNQLGFSSLASCMYSDFRKESISANETGTYWEEALYMAADSLDKLLLKKAYAYAFPYADVITDVPVFSSQYDIEDEAVPFYQMAVGGSAALYSEPVNESGNIREMLLHCVEYGVSPSFLLMAAQPDILQETDYQKFYSIAWSDWKEQIQGMLDELSTLDTVCGQALIHHGKVQDGVYECIYQDGTVVYVNYQKETVLLKDTQIPARGFARKGEK
ncbi:MAG: hypothetical protein K2N63_04395 [Lachnospiraceae bacterium]|nr:hypothetical protein [Lachnospiraceae bacterium]